MVSGREAVATTVRPVSRRAICVRIEPTPPAPLMNRARERRAGAQDLRPSLLGLYKISLGRYTLALTFSEEELFFSVPLSPDSPFLVVVSAFVPPL